jgi:hypothetical protein
MSATVSDKRTLSKQKLMEYCNVHREELANKLDLFICFDYTWLEEDSKEPMIGSLAALRKSVQPGTQRITSQIKDVFEGIEHEKVLEKKRNYVPSNPKEVFRYNLNVCEGVMDFVHGGGYMTQELFVPSLKMCLNTSGTSSNYFRSAYDRSKDGNVDVIIASDEIYVKLERINQVIHQRDQIQPDLSAVFTSLKMSVEECEEGSDSEDESIQ